MTINQKPDAFSLSSVINDFIIDSENSVVFKLEYNGKTIIEELYDPDTDNKIYIRFLDELINDYLTSKITDLVHDSLSGSFTWTLTDQTTNTSLSDSFTCLRCLAYTDVPASEYFNGNVFLNLMKRTKTSIPQAKEYVTCKLVSDIKVFVTYSDSFINSDEVVLNNEKSGLWKTLDVSLPTIAPLFPGISLSDIKAIRVKLPSHIHVILIDRENYVSPVVFRFKNYFGVPETIITRGDISRTGETTFETGKIGRIEKKFNNKRSDPFEVNTGKIFSMNDYDRFAELFDSEDVQVFMFNNWIDIVITEETSSRSLRSGNFSPFSFKFRFAKEIDNKKIISSKWVLNDGTWIDDNIFTETGHWND